MTNSLNEVIKNLERQRAAIERALQALREVEGQNPEASPAEAPAPPASTSPRNTERKSGMTPEGRKRLSEALKARWAAKKTDSSASVVAASEKRKGGMTPEGRQRLSEALRKRWASKRAAAAAPAKRGARK
jgi:hypothetical protein